MNNSFCVKVNITGIHAGVYIKIGRIFNYFYDKEADVTIRNMPSKSGKVKLNSLKQLDKLSEGCIQFLHSTNCVSEIRKYPSIDGMSNAGFQSDNNSYQNVSGHEETVFSSRNPQIFVVNGHGDSKSKHEVVEFPRIEAATNNAEKNPDRGDTVPLDDEIEQYEESSDDEEEYSNDFARKIGAIRKSLYVIYQEHNSVSRTTVTIVLTILYFAYFVYAMIKTFDVHDEGSMRLLIVTILVTFYFVAAFLWKHLSKHWNTSDKLCNLKGPLYNRIQKIIFWVLVSATTLFFVIFVIVDIAIDRPENLISALGMMVFVLVFWLFSKNPAKVNWRPVFWGLALQFYFALLILRTKFGYQAFKWLGERVSEFLAHTNKGSIFVFGTKYEDHFFAFKVLTVIVFFSTMINVLYYLGVMQFVIRYIARFLAFCLGTSPTESLNAAGNIFIGQSEAPLLIRPFIKDMTRSELHAVCTGGFATIAGSVMAAYILMGIPANHLLSASVMSAPAALAMAKLFYPETKKTKLNSKGIYNMKKGNETNIIEAASNGATLSIRLVSNIAVNLIAFLAVLEFVNRTLIWCGHRVGMYNPELTFTLICSYAFYPVSWLLGTSPSDVRKVAGMIGTKTFLNEFVAYAELATFIDNTKKYNNYIGNTTMFNNGTTYDSDNIIINYTGDVLVGGIITDRSVVVATYALCGFSNVGSIGVVLGSLGAIVPTRKKDLTKVIIRAMIAGNVACFMTACIAGLLYEGAK